MTPTACILFFSCERTRLAIRTGGGFAWHELSKAKDAVEGEHPATPDEIVSWLVGLIGKYKQRRIILALDSALCLSATVSMLQIPRRGRHQFLICRFEEKLPVAAEDFVADFIIGKECSLGVCIRPEDVQWLLKAMEESNLAVDIVTPTAILATEHWLKENASHTSVELLIWETETTVELIIIRQGLPQQWYVLPSDKDMIVEHLQGFQRTNETIHVTAYLQSPELREILGGFGDGVAVMEMPLELSAATTAADLVEHQRPPSINLRRDVLAPASPLRAVRRPLSAALVTLSIFLLSACAAFFWRAHKDRMLAEQFADQQAIIFTQLMPHQAVPLDIPARLESEASKLDALSGKSFDLKRSPPALITLRDLVVNLPPNVRFRIDRIHILPDRLSLDGQVRSHGDAESLVAGLNKIQAYMVGPPHTEQNGEHEVTFTISGGLRTLNPLIETR